MAAFAEGTLSNLTTQWVKFLSFFLIYDLDPLPVKEEDLCRYADFLGSCLKSHKSVISYLSGVKTLHILLGYSVAAFNSLSLRLTLRGMHRLNPHVPNQAPPISVDILSKIYKLLNMDNEDDVIFWAVVLVGFFLLLRKCNLVPVSSNKFDPSKQLKRSDLQIAPDHIKVTLRWTKNNQFTKEALRFALPFIQDSVLCPSTAVLDAIAFSPRC